MPRKLYIGNLRYTTTEDALRAACEAYGDVTDVKIIIDRETNQSKGFAFVTWTNEADAVLARENLNDFDLDGRALRVDWAEERAPTDRGHRGGKGRSGGNGGDKGGGKRREDISSK